MTAVQDYAVAHVPACAITAGDNDRKQFDPAALEALAQSIARDGLAQPPTVRPAGAGYQIVAGERRVRAMRLLGWETIPVIIRDMDDGAASATMLVENMVRVNLDALEEARAYAARIETGATVAELADLVGVSQRTIRARIDLLRLSPDAQALISSGNLGLGHASQLVGLDMERQSLALRALATGELTLPAFTALCDRLRREQETEPIFDAASFFQVEEYNATALREAELAKLSVMPGQMLTRREVAELAGLKPASVWRLVVRGTFPKPDGYFGTVGWWKPETVTAWQASRRPSGRPRKTLVADDEDQQRDNGEHH